MGSKVRDAVPPSSSPDHHMAGMFLGAQTGTLIHPLTRLASPGSQSVLGNRQGKLCPSSISMSPWDNHVLGCKALKAVPPFPWLAS